MSVLSNDGRRGIGSIKNRRKDTIAAPLIIGQDVLLSNPVCAKMV